jgi:orotidine 5''-phosphate decarboxylase, subfamily 1
MSKKIIVAIDETDIILFKKIVTALDKEKCLIKIGSVSFNSIGKEAVDYASSLGFDIFLDLKLHDIPNTVEQSIKGLSSLPIKMLTIHISGGTEMMKAAKKAVSGTKIKIFGVTTLTSLNDDDTNYIFRRSASEQVLKMLDMAESVGIDGVVCSPQELEIVKSRKSLLCMTPGIRLDHLNDDQKRVMSPKNAIDLGADYIVIGRPITLSNDINKTLNDIYQSIL